jgi:hypothetical protein
MVQGKVTWRFLRASITFPSQIPVPLSSSGVNTNEALVTEYSLDNINTSCGENPIDSTLLKFYLQILSSYVQKYLD